MTCACIFLADSGNGDRAMGYKKKSNVVTTVRPTWRPWQIPKEIENPGKNSSTFKC